MSLRHQIIALTVIPLIVAILTVTTFITLQSANLIGSSIGTFERNMLKAKETELLNMTNLALSAIQGIYQAAGPDDEAAKEKVREILTSLDYGQDGYFFAYDYDGNNIVHPRQTYRPGRNWLDLTDPDGDHVIANLIGKAKAGGGLHQYKWQKPSSGEMADKLSFAVGLDKWKWMLGTGVYLDDVFLQTAAAKADLRANIRRTFTIVALTALPSVLLVFAACILVTLRERRMADGKLKELTKRIIGAQEQERARLARELHDGISQNLVGVRYAIDLASRKVKSGANDAAQAIGKGADALNGAIKEVRRLSHDLRPRALDDLGLSAALQALLSEFFERTGIAMSLDAAPFRDTLKPEAATALYRVAQEALHNIEKHSGATRGDIKVWTVTGRVRMTVSDNGGGFEKSAKRNASSEGGLGIRNMQERMAHFGGVLLIRSAEDGTTLTAMLPRSASLAAIKTKDAA
ncbi:histidine kinase [Rhizobiales bacterium RZME27]|jgi:two-component system NarL family sensor kinase|uniref:histidine kinase n=1 Tax=Endobacterium cereale TaxID=2663029 RepID=A0A6A8A7Q6_9HYPH|nr:cache domain-containing protein [Endobacterium cereale]MQY46789.1 histidine kinase [Endobacterium cereale]